MSLSNISLYGLLGFSAYKAYTSERLDLYCPGEVNKYCKNLCGDNKGKYYIQGQPKNTDNVNELLNKIKISANATLNTVKWRRSLLLAVVIAIFISMIILEKFPSGKQLFLMVFLTFIIIYFSFSYYEYHYEKYPVNNIHKSINYIRNQLNLKNLDEILII
jgi:uncharacterized membrane protein